MTPFGPLLVAVVVAAVIAAQPASAARLEEARKLIRAGSLEAGIRLLERIVASAPESFDARLALGQGLDLAGRHREARAHLEDAIDLATDETRHTALTALGISYAFQARADDAARYYQRAYDVRVQADDPRGAAALANALGRIYLESGNLPRAEQWYTTGYETARKIPAITAQERLLWDMRRLHALGRIEARRGNLEEARRHAEGVRLVLEKGGNDDQRVALPYLQGYIAFYAKDDRLAIDELRKGDQEDPFVLGMIARSFERLRDRRQAAEYYRRVMAIPVHNINAAFSRPRARAFLR